MLKPSLSRIRRTLDAILSKVGRNQKPLVHQTKFFDEKILKVYRLRKITTNEDKKTRKIILKMLDRRVHDYRIYVSVSMWVVFRYVYFVDRRFWKSVRVHPHPCHPAVVFTATAWTTKVSLNGEPACLESITHQSNFAIWCKVAKTKN